MTFDNPIAGGETLIRSALKSPNYQKGLTGWAVNADGSAEFNDISVTSGSVDTAGSGSVGVKVYTDTSNPGSGVVEWDAYSASAKASLTSSQTGSGGSYFKEELVGGPSIELNIEGLPQGGYGNVIHFNAGGGTFDFDDDTGWQNIPLINGWTVIGEGAHYRVRNGLCHFQFGANAPSPFNGNAAQFPVGARPPFTHWFAGTWGTQRMEWKILSSGLVVVSTDQNNNTAPGVVSSGVFPIN